MKKQTKKNLTKELLQIRAIKGVNRKNYLLVIKDNSTNIIEETKINIDEIGSVEKYCIDNNIEFKNYYNGFYNGDNGRTRKLAESCQCFDCNCGKDDYEDLKGFFADYIGDWYTKLTPYKPNVNNEEVLLTVYKPTTIIGDIDTSL